MAPCFPCPTQAATATSSFLLESVLIVAMSKIGPRLLKRSHTVRTSASWSVATSLVKRAFSSSSSSFPSPTADLSITSCARLPSSSTKFLLEALAEPEDVTLQRSSAELPNLEPRKTRVSDRTEMQDGTELEPQDLNSKTLEAVLVLTEPESILTVKWTSWPLLRDNRPCTLPNPPPSFCLKHSSHVSLQSFKSSIIALSF
mmetsp:Transcript_6735/g.20269  ORF Transcript_6735/g.20269 Transcript_6735/m.20269 type:complete len:201 (+) Transcript_6735:2527-3129(+)